MPRELSVETRGHWKSVLPGPQHTPWWRSVQGWWRDISYLSKVTDGGKPGRISILQLGWELQAPPGGATSGQQLGFSWEGVASMGSWRMKWEEGAHVAHLRMGMSPRIYEWAGRDLWAEVWGISLQGAWGHWDDPRLWILSLGLSGPGKIQVMLGNETRRTDSLRSFHALMEDAIWFWFLAQY